MHPEISRAQALSKLSFLGKNGNSDGLTRFPRSNSSVTCGLCIYRHVLQVLGPSDIYRDAELSLISRFSDWLDAHASSRSFWVEKDTAKGYPSAGFLMDSPFHLCPTTFGQKRDWTVKRLVWKSGSHYPTLAEALSYITGICARPAEDILQVCAADMVPFTFDPAKAPPSRLLLVAGTPELLAEMMDSYRAEKAALTA